MEFTGLLPLSLGGDLLPCEGISIVCDLELARENNDGIPEVEIPLLHTLHWYPLQEQPLGPQVVLKVSRYSKCQLLQSKCVSAGSYGVLQILLSASQFLVRWLYFYLYVC